MAQQIILPSASSRNPIVFLPLSAVPEDKIPDLITLDGGQVISAPVWDPLHRTLVVDTGESVMELSIPEINVLRAVLAAWDAHQSVVA